MSDQPFQPTREAVEAAHERLGGLAHRTPVLTSAFFNQRLGAELFFKCENFQKVGAFKFRGAFNTVASLSEEERARGVATHSSGNHAQALALAAQMHGIDAHIVMPENAPSVKQNAVRGYGANVILCEPTIDAREVTLCKVLEETGGVMVHPYNDPRIIAGQATSAKELLEDVNDLDAVLAPIGGGGLAAGTALSAEYFSPSTKVYGVEPAGAADAQLSLKTGTIQPSKNPQTIADGLLTHLGEHTFAVIRRRIEDILTVTDDVLIETMRLVWERMKIVIEPSAAVPLAMLLDGGLDIRGKRVGVIFSGGNVDLNGLPWAH